MLNDAYKKDLKRFDMERALPAFDGLIAKQQAALARLNVPTMSVSDDTDLREVSSTCLLAVANVERNILQRQQRVMQVLTGLVESCDPSPPSILAGQQTPSVG